jgi:hypothetical protein
MDDLKALLKAARESHGKYKPKISAILDFPENTAKEALACLANEMPWWRLVAQLERESQSPFSRKKICEGIDLLLSVYPERKATNTLCLPGDWYGFKSIEEQCGLWGEFFNHRLACDDVLNAAKGAKRSMIEKNQLLVLPKLSYLARRFGSYWSPTTIESASAPWNDNKDGKEVYPRILRGLINRVKQKRHGLIQYDFIGDRLSSSHVRLSPAARAAWRKLESMFIGDLVLIAADSGSLYAGHSSRFARISAIALDQFPLDAVAVLSLLFTHPRRLCKESHPGIDCPGTAFSCSGTKRFFEVMCIAFFDGERHLGEYCADEAVQGFGPAMGWFV